MTEDHTLHPDLKPCPFCGERRIYLNAPSKSSRHGSINCPACLVVMPGEVSRDELIACWNERHTDTPGEQT